MHIVSEYDERIHMIGIATVAKIVQIMTKSPVKDFLISFTAGATWDGVKLIPKFIKKDSVQLKIWSLFSFTMEQFYGQLHFEYNEQIVVLCVIEEFAQNIETLNALNIRAYLEHAMFGDFRKLTDREFELWVAIFANRCAMYPEIFQMYKIENEIKDIFSIKRDLLLEKICSKVCITIGDEEHSDWNYYLLIKNVIDIFQQSWKDDILSSINKLPRLKNDSQKVETLLDLIYSNEDCEVVLESFRKLFLLHESSSIERKTYFEIRDKLERPHFNKVWIVTGTTGSGKTYFVNEFLKATVELLDDLEGKIIPVVINVSKITNGVPFNELLSQEFNKYLGVKLDTIEDTDQMMKEMDSQICFIIDGASNLFSSKEEWEFLIGGIVDCSKYDQLRWIITIDEYDYYFLENDRVFLEKYCLTQTQVTHQESEKESLFYNAFSTDQYNEEHGIIESILNNKFGMDEESLEDLDLVGITTPKEAMIFCDSVPREGMRAIPTTYYEYLRNVTTWKNDELVSVSGGSVAQVLSPVIEYVSEYCTDELIGINCELDDLIPLRKVKLIRPELMRDIDIFSLSQGTTIITYRLNIYPFWAVKIINTLDKNLEKAVDKLTQFPRNMQNALIPSFIFYHFGEIKTELSGLTYFFEVLRINNVLIYVLFAARKASIEFSKRLYGYLYNYMDTIIDGPQICYSVLYFVFNSSLKMREKLQLLNEIAQYIDQFEFEEIYERVFCYVISFAQNEKKFKKNLSVVAKGKIVNINYINGKNAAMQYLSIPSVYEKDIENIIWDIVDYIKVHDLIHEVNINSEYNNKSFMDFFIRRCFEMYLNRNPNSISTIYQRFEKYFMLDKPLGHFIKRNLTCAAGNIFSNMNNFRYKELYVNLTGMMSKSGRRMDRLTALFLIENSVDENHMELNPRLREILLELMRDKDLFLEYRVIFEKLTAI